MEVEYHVGAGSFLEMAGPYLRGDVARNQLLLGVAEQAHGQPEVYPVFHGWVAVDEGRPVAVASCTPPYNYIVGDAVTLDAVRALAAAIAGSGVVAPGVVGNRPHVDIFAESWARVTGAGVKVEMGQGIFAMSRVEEIGAATGHMREAEPGDRGLLIEWMRAFYEEAAPGEPTEFLEDRIDQRLDPDLPQGMSVWEQGGELVSMSGYSHPVSNCIRIGPVYTPGELRGQGYATSLVAAQGIRFFGEGRDLCLLYTDLANPTSNAIYRRIGYRQVGESMVCSFTV